MIDVTGFGGTVKQYQVLLDNQLMRRYDVTLQMVTDAISQSNANVGGDLLPLGPQSHNVRALGYLGEGIDSLDPAVADHAYGLEIEKIEDIEDVVVTTYHDMPVYIRQIAKVVVGFQPRLGLVGRNRENDVVEGIVLMRKYEKSLPTSQAVQDKIDSINKSNLLPKGMLIEYFNRRTDLVEVTKHNVIHNLVVGMILVIGILFIFLGDISSAGIVALMIPLALLFSISVLYVQGKSANLLSIGAVDFGIIVDSSVIIVENIYRHITARNADRSRPLIDRICEASHEIERALFFSTLIIVCAFIPLFSMTGPEGALFGPMANTYAFAICGALVLAVTLTPVLCSYLFHNKKEEKETFIDRIMKLRYLTMLDRVLRHRYLVLVGMGGLLALTLVLVPTLGGEFMPPLEEGNLWIRALLPRTVTLGEAARMAPRLRRVIDSIPEIRDVMSHVGRPDDGTDVTSFFNLEFNAPLIPMEEWRDMPVKIFGQTVWSRKITREEIQDELMDKFKDFPAINFNFSQLIRDNVEEALSGVKGANSIKLFGNDLAVLERAGQRVVNILNTVPGISNAGLFHIVGQPNLEIQIDRHECARYGINVSDVEAVVQVAIGGRAFTRMVEGEKVFDIVLRLPADQRNDPEVIGRIPVDAPGQDGKPGARIPLSQLVVRIDPHKPGATYIYRENNRRYIPIKFGVKGRDLASTILEARAQGDRSENWSAAPTGVRYWLGGRVRPDAASQPAVDGDRSSVDHVDSDPAVHGVQFAERRASGDGERGCRDDGGCLGAQVDRYGLLDFGGGGIHFDIRSCGAGWSALDLVLQSDAGGRLAGSRVTAARCRIASSAGGHDVADGSAWALSGGHRDFDRFSGTEAAGDRGRGRDAGDSFPDEIPDACAVLVLSGTGGTRRVPERPDSGITLHRSLPPAGKLRRGHRPGR